ncbi:MAG: HAMP domain-containing protein [Acidobacteriia bacterium]|nr:HAMP domain-containing protein [Terriglobia bacterium]
MNSLFGKILLWFWTWVIIAVVGSAFISAWEYRHNASDRKAPAAELVAFQLSQARLAYETGGRPRLKRFLDTVYSIYGAQGILTNEKGIDLLTGQDRSYLIDRARRKAPYQFFSAGNSMVARAADDGRYWYFYEVGRQQVGMWFIEWDHLFVLLAAVLLCYWLALHLTEPVRQLQKAVEQFGRGNLSARVNSRRRDELGQLARTFDRMAGRIETLLAAERRLLLDVSHELRSPLARLGVAVELARSGDAVGRNLDRIQKESDRLNSLVGQLPQVTRAEGDPSVLRREPVRVDELVQQLVDDSAIEAQAHGCALKYERSQPVTVEGDPELLRRAVENVIRNAIRYAPRETAVEVSLGRNNGTAILDVRDHGPGFPEEALPRIFDAFYRVDSDRARSSGGVGLGLSIARRAIELHKGVIRARNRQPGLEVEMQLPASDIR